MKMFIVPRWNKVNKILLKINEDDSNKIFNYDVKCDFQWEFELKEMSEEQHICL